MGWRGSLRTINAAINKAERAQRSRQREIERQRAHYQKMEAIQRAYFEVQEFENLIDVLLSVHKECSEKIDWVEISCLPEPRTPYKASDHEKKATDILKNYKPSFFDKLFKRVEKRKETLTNNVRLAIEKDEETHNKNIDEYNDEFSNWKRTITTAEGVLNGDTDYYKEVLKEINPLEELGTLGSSLEINFPTNKIAEVELFVNSEEVVPKESKSLLKSGKLSIKAMAKTRFFEIYQDYVCGSILRIARELFAILPLDYVVVTAIAELLDTITGNIVQKPILSVAIPRQILEKLNFDKIDPSDSLKNFVHSIKFMKTKGFSEAEKLDYKKFE